MCCFTCLKRARVEEEETHPVNLLLLHSSQGQLCPGCEHKCWLLAKAVEKPLFYLSTFFRHTELFTFNSCLKPWKREPGIVEDAAVSSARPLFGPPRQGPQEIFHTAWLICRLLLVLNWTFMAPVPLCSSFFPHFVFVFLLPILCPDALCLGSYRTFKFYPRVCCPNGSECCMMGKGEHGTRQVNNPHCYSNPSVQAGQLLSQDNI